MPESSGGTDQVEFRMLERCKPSISFIDFADRSEYFLSGSPYVDYGMQRCVVKEYERIA